MKKKEQGILTVEASIVLTLFLLFVLFLFSFARMYRAQNMISHATMQSADALALESYIREVAHDEDASEIIKLGNQLSGLTSLSEESFTSLRAADIPKLAKEKFAVAISSSEANADAILKKLGVKGGLSGVDFSVSKMDLDSNDVIVYANYTLELQFPVFGFSEINVTKAARAKTFGDILFEICTISNDDNMGTASGGGSYKHGTTIEITAEPKYGYCFEGWDDDGDGDVDYDGGKATTASKRTVTVTDAKTYTAIFKNNGYGVNAAIYIDGIEDTKGIGTITMVPMPDPATGKHSFNQTVDVTATISENYRNHYDWLGWTGQLRQDKDGDGVEETILSISDPKNNLKYTIPQVKGNYQLKANFSPKEYTVTVKTDGGGSVEIVGHASNKKTVTYPGSVTIKAKPNDGYVLDYWLKNGVKLEGCNGKNELPNIAVNENVEYKAVFKNVKVNVYFYGADNKTVIATISANKESTFNKQGLTVPAPTTDSNYVFSGWKGFSGNTPINGEMHVYGEWGELNVNIKVESNSGHSAVLVAETFPISANVKWEVNNKAVKITVDPSNTHRATITLDDTAINKMELSEKRKTTNSIGIGKAGNVQTSTLYNYIDSKITASITVYGMSDSSSKTIKSRESVDIGYVEYWKCNKSPCKEDNAGTKQERHYYKNAVSGALNKNGGTYHWTTGSYDRKWSITYSEYVKLKNKTSIQIANGGGSSTADKNKFTPVDGLRQNGINKSGETGYVVKCPFGKGYGVLTFVRGWHSEAKKSDGTYYDYYILEIK